MSKWTVVCSNHFAAGYYSDTCNIPTLYMKGYTGSLNNLNSSKKRKEPSDRTVPSVPNKHSRNILRDESDNTFPVTEVQTQSVMDHGL